jgi:hypothetical protein
MQEQVNSNSDKGNLASGSNQSCAPEFELVKRPHGDCVRMTGQPIWIVYYGPVDGYRTERWYAFKSVERIPKGRDPWTVDNRRLCKGGGFLTFRDAVAACRAAIAEAAA